MDAGQRAKLLPAAILSPWPATAGSAPTISTTAALNQKWTTDLTMGCLVKKQAATNKGIARISLATVVDVPSTICTVAGKRVCFSTLFLQLWHLLHPLYEHVPWCPCRFPVAAVLGAVRADF
jgi:hypothetical protein